MKRAEFFKSPLDGFLVYKTDDAGDPAYTGFQNFFGDYIIMRETKSTGVMEYTFGQGTGFDTAWTGRAGLTYTSPAVCFASLKQ
jgi:hypothetical protein